MPSVILDIFEVIYSKNNLIWPFQLLVPRLCLFPYLVYSRGQHGPTYVPLLCDIFLNRMWAMQKYLRQPSEAKTRCHVSWILQQFGCQQIIEKNRSQIQSKQWTIMVSVLALLRTLKTLLLECNLTIMCTEVVLATCMLALEQTTGNDCVAWGQMCNACGKCNHFAKVCWSKVRNQWSTI